MDRSWMYIKRTSRQYLEGVDGFLAVAIENQKKTGLMIRCPCVDCKNSRCPSRISIIKDHLIRRGFMLGYTTWTYHGEVLDHVGTSFKRVTHPLGDSNVFEEDQDRIDDVLHDVEINNFTEDPHIFDSIHRAPTTELYPEWDYMNRPVGNWAPRLSTQCGVIAQDKVSIKYATWFDVPASIKETIWLNLQVMFHIPDKKMYRSHVMNTVAEAWKGWKSKIKEKFIDNEKDPTTPWPYEEGLCTKEDFEILKAQVTSPEFEEKSEKAKKSKAHDEHPHFLGKRSYGQLENLWQEQGDNYTTMKSLSQGSCNNEHIVEIKALNWVNAQMRDKIESYKQIHAVKDNIIDVQQKVHQSGMDSEVGFTRVFDSSTRSSSSQSCTTPVFDSSARLSSSQSHATTDIINDAIYQTVIAEKVAQEVAAQVEVGIAAMEARFMAQIEARTAVIKAQMEARMAEMEARMASLAALQTQTSPAMGSSHGLVDPLPGFEANSVVHSAKKVTTTKNRQRKWEVQLPPSCIALKAIVDTFNQSTTILVLDPNHVVIHSSNTMGALFLHYKQSMSSSGLKCLT